MKIGIIGSRDYQNFRKVKDTIFALKNKFEPDLTIVSGGCLDGADRFAKKYAIILNLILRIHLKTYILHYTKTTMEKFISLRTFFIEIKCLLIM